MPRFQAPTILALVLFSFLVVVLPILAGLVRSFETLETMSLNHQTALANVVSYTEASEATNSSLSALERAARQYQVLKENSFLEVFNDRYVALREALLTLSSSSDKTLQSTAEKMITEIDEMHPSFNVKESKDNDRLEQELLRFERLFFMAKKLGEQVSSFSKKQVAGAKQQVNRVSRELVLYVVTLIPLTAVLILIFTVLILKPLRQIDRAIKRLGQGDFSSDFKIKGPRDLKKVALRLTWLGRRLKAAEEEKMKFLRHISHELKTPLSTIKEGTELLEDEIPGPLNDSQKQVLKISSKAVDSFQSLINNLLDFNLMTREATLQKKTFSVKEIVLDTVSPYQLTAERKQLKVKMQGPDLSIRVDRSVFKAALDNLISNAIHYTPANGQVEIGWSMNSEGFRIAVKDSGPGIPESEHEQVFLPFFQGEAKKEGPLKGTGLGLSVAKECVESHQGTLQILKEKVGAHLEIRLPAHVLKENME